MPRLTFASRAKRLANSLARRSGALRRYVTASTAGVFVAAYLVVVGIHRGWFSEEMAAWVQAIGSIAAIGAAVWIDQGQARRMLAEDRRRRSEAAADWENALEQAARLVRNAHRLAGADKKDEISEAFIARLIDNAGMMLDAYLRQPPPSPRLVFVLSAARSFVQLPENALRKWRDADGKFLAKSYSTRIQMIEQIHGALDTAANELDGLLDEYREGVI